MEKLLTFVKKKKIDIEIMEKPVAGKDVALQKQETSTHNAMFYELPLSKVGCHLRPQNKAKYRPYRPRSTASWKVLILRRQFFCGTPYTVCAIFKCCHSETLLI